MAKVLCAWQLPRESTTGQRLADAWAFWGCSVLEPGGVLKLILENSVCSPF